jgi:hypothetical protein
MLVKRKDLTIEQKEIVRTLANDDITQRKNVDTLGINRSGVCRFLKRFNNIENIENVSRCGRSLKVWKRGDRQIVSVSRTNRRAPLSELTCIVNKLLESASYRPLYIPCIVNQTLPQNISSRTVRHRLRFHG